MYVITHTYIYILHNYPHSINPWVNHHLGRLQAALAFFSGRKKNGQRRRLRGRSSGSGEPGRGSRSGKNIQKTGLPTGKLRVCYGKSLFLGKLTNEMAMFNRYVTNYQV